MFIQHEEKIINTDNVSNIVFDKEKLKIIFNTNYSVSLHDNNSKLIPDYVYFICDNNSFERIRQDILDLDWISSEYGYYKRDVWKTNNRLINPTCISFIKIEDWKPRIIFNLNTSVSYYKHDNEITSDFIFYDYENISDMKDELYKIKEKLNVRKGK